jgi:hypothetical protein
MTFDTNVTILCLSGRDLAPELVDEARLATRDK